MYLKSKVYNDFVKRDGGGNLVQSQFENEV